MNTKVTQVSTGPLTGVLKVKYKVISTILGELYDAPSGLDIFIDFNTFIKSIASYQKYLNYLPFAEGSDVETDLMSSILTTLSHWKNFSRKWENVRIFGIMNALEMDHVCESKYLKSYMIPYLNKFKNVKFQQFVYFVTEAVKKVQMILKYVPNMYFITSNEFDSLVLPNLMDDYEKTGRQRIIVSGSSLMTGYHMLPNTKVIYTKFRRNGSQQISDPLMIVQSFTKVDEDIMEEFIKNKVFYNLLNIIVGDFERGIVGMTQIGITTFAYNLLRGIEQNKIQPNPKSVESTLAVIDNNFHDYIVKSYPLVDIQTHSDMIPQSAIQRIKSEMIDLIDIDGLQSLSIDGLNLLELL